MIETISNILEPYKTIVGTVAGIVTLLQMFSGIPVVLDIKRRGSTTGFPIMPFLGGLVFGIINLQFGFILNDDTMIRVNFFGLFLNIIYLMVFYIYTPGPEKIEVWAKFGYAGAFSAAIVAYSNFEDPAKLEQRLGLLLSVFLFILIGFPLKDMPNHFRLKSSYGIPFPIVASGTVVGFLWLLYGFCIHNRTIIYQNILALILSAPQIYVCLAYPATPPEEIKKDTDKKKN